MLASALAALDVVLDDVILITALVAPPLLAAVRASPLATAVVCAYCLALTGWLGAVNGILGSHEHVVRVTIVLAAGLGAIWLARLSDRLIKSRADLDAILEGVADAVMARDADGTPVFVNSAAAELLEFSSKEELLAWPGEPVARNLKVMTEDGRRLAGFELPGQRAARGEPVEPTTVRLLSRNTGRERWAVVKAINISASGHRPGLAITVVEDVTELKRLERRQRLLARTGQALGSSLDYHETLQAAAELTVPDLADWCRIDEVDAANRRHPVAIASSDERRLSLVRELRDRNPYDPDAAEGSSRALRTGEPILYAEIDDDLLRRAARTPRQLEVLRALELESLIIVPLGVADRALGVLSLATSESGRRFDEEDLELASELADRMATALENARLYQQRSRIAGVLQRSLLPPALPLVAGLELAAKFIPAGEGVDVGGDFYDVFEGGQGQWSVAMGDVCGKGPDAAAVTALARYTLRTAAMRERRPSRILATLNEAMLRDPHDLRFATVALASLKLNGASAVLSVACGGHPQPLLRRASGEVIRVGRPGTVLGVVEDPRLDEEEVRLERGDVLLLYTDGLTEAYAPRRIVSAAELSVELAACGDLDAAGVATRMERYALAGEGEPRDDVAILVLKLG